MNSGPKVNPLGALHSVDYASEMNFAQASIVSDSARLHNRLIHSRRTIKRNFARISGESRYDHGCRTVLQRDQHLGVFKVLIVAMDKLSLEVDDPLAGSGHFPKERQTYLAVPANFLRLIQIAFFSKRKLEHISGREPHGCIRTWRIRQGR